ncbi:SPOR domain-containing protein [Sphingomonas sp. 35-24ZXX]|uniref:SPOR domain-containing protein n=1 Tax=Sphingomonas sp. 35-24ZXX TaxID=1545915 RepID=UPI00053BEC4C|nr:SPOR domain-containing protein [Sphingomonas sp. 35-24ZXX]
MALKPFSRPLRLRVASWLLAAASLSLSPAFAQEEGPDSPGADETGYSSLDVSAPRGTRELQNALQRLALNPGDVDALIDGGNAALLLGDPQAAIGFFARADEMSPGNGRVKAGLGSSLLLNENPYEALRLFEEAKRLGVPETVFASDRGLAYDLVGNSNAAQADYELALRRGGDDETIRRYALSLGISGDRAAAEAQLDPLLRKRDAAAWRTRAFVLAVSGDAEGAIAIADATMPRRMAASIQPFFRFMGKLTPAQQAAAAHFGQFPQSAAIGKDDPRNRQYASAGSPRVRSSRADAGLIPAGEPLGPTTDSKARKVAKVDKSQRRRPGKLSKKEREAIALAQAEAAAKPVPVQTRPPGPVPPSDLLIPGRGTGASDTGGYGQTARATVQPLPGSYASAQPSRATVQPLPGSSSQVRSPSPAPSPAPRAAEPAPVRIAAAPTDAGQSPLDAPRGAVRVDAMPSGETAAAQSAAAARAARLESVQTKVATAKPVLLPGVKELPRPGFDSVPAAASPPPPSVAPQPTTQPVNTQPAKTVAQPAQQAMQSVQPAPTGAGASQAFDLAQMGPPAPAPSPGSAVPSSVAPAPSGPAPTLASAAPTPATVQPVPAAPEPERVSLAAVIASIQVPAAELAPSADAVDITKLTPAAKKPDEADAAKKAEEKKAADKLAADKLAADKKAADKKASDDKKLAEKKAADKKAAAAKKAAPKHPKRYWVQVAGGANRADLSKEWKRLTSTSPAVFKGKQGWWTPLNATNRLLTGPFGSAAEAQAFVNTLSKNKLSGFSFTSPEGQEVTKLGG